MKQLLNLYREVLSQGTLQANRTGVKAITTTGAMMKFDMADGFPAVTTKKLAFKQLKGELLGFLRAYDNAGDFRSLGCTIWDQNANEHQGWLNNPHRKGHDDLGRVYGVQWRYWKTEGGGFVDQVAIALQTIMNDPTNRRIIINAWRPDEFHLMALPPCHVLYEFTVNVEKNQLNLVMFQRSADCFLGVPFNIASASLMLCLFARLTGTEPGTFTHFLADTHIYENHIDQVDEQLTRTPYPPPQLWLDDAIQPLAKDATEADIDVALRAIQPDHIKLFGYESHDSIKAPMAV